MRARIFGAGLSLLMLGACGGGGGSGSGSGGGTPAIPNLNVTLSASETTASIEEDDVPASVSFTATSSGAVSTPVFADVAYDPEIFASVNVTPGATTNTYTVTATPRPDIGGGDFDGKITFRLCMEAACTRVYGGSTRTHNHKLKVKLRDWVMFQRDAGHTGYVHVRLDPSKFKKAWEWSGPEYTRYSAVISQGGNAFFSSLDGNVRSLSEVDGKVNWSYDGFNEGMSGLGALAYNNGTIYAPGYFHKPNQTIFTGDAVIRGFNAQTGIKQSDVSFVSQVGVFNSPTILGTDMYYSQGYYGGVVYKYDLSNHSETWRTEFVHSNIYGGQAPAVDEKYVYYSTNFGLAVYNKVNGVLVDNVASLRGSSSSDGMLMSPVLTKNQKVIFVTRNDKAGVVAADVNSLKVLWTSKAPYMTSIASARKVIYASSINPAGIHALDEDTGDVLWRWVLPETDYDMVTRNIIVCDNIMFVSGNKAVYAIDLKTHKTVWTFEGGGELSLSSNFMLYISYSAHDQLSKIVAISLR